jgi:glycosyltransferase involved in cell wall biosynthesis
MAAGLPVVVSDRAGITEFVRDGKHALFFPAGDPDALADRLRSVMTVPGLASRLQQAARDHAVRIFSTRRMVDEMEAFLGDALTCRARASQGSAAGIAVPDVP